MPSIPVFSVIRISFDFRDGAGPVKKRFVLLGYVESAAICVKRHPKLNGTPATTELSTTRPERAHHSKLVRC